MSLLLHVSTRLSALDRRALWGGMLLIVCAIISHPARSQSAADPLAQALERRSADMTRDYRYDRTTVVRTAGDAAETSVQRYDPTRPAGQRWQTLSGRKDAAPRTESGTTSTASDLMGYRELKDAVRDGQVRRVADRDGAAVYHLRTRGGRGLHTGGVRIEGLDGFREAMTGWIYVYRDAQGRPYVGTLMLALPAPVDATVVKVRTLAIGHAFAPDPQSGAMRTRAFRLNLDMTALWAIPVKLAVSASNSGFVPVGR